MSYTLRPIRFDGVLWQSRAQEGEDVCASVKVRGLSECTCVGVIFHLETLAPFRRQGLASLLMREVEALAERENLSLLVSTVRVSNTPCRALHSKFGYEVAQTWNNGRTGNDLILFCKKLRRPLSPIW